MKIAPSKRQLEFLDWEFGAFFHFGIRSFFRNHKDWDGQEMPASAFDPQELDCEQWIRTAKEAGMTYAILTAKHHDGFANWPSKYTSYSVAASPWKGGKGDVVREFVDACRKYDMKVGLYYSPAQWTETEEVSFQNSKEYDDYFIHQISELLGNYGTIDYLWFDGNGSQKHEFAKARIIRTIRTLQPEIRIFSMWDPDTRWVGNEDGYADLPNFSTLEHAVISVESDQPEEYSAMKFLPAECDMKMRSTWFDCEENEDTIKELDELLGIYEMSVGRGANLLLNIGPDRRGLLSEADTKRLLEFGAAIRERYGKALDFSEMAPVDGTEDAYFIQTADFTEKWGVKVTSPLVNRVMLSEDLTEGESVRAFRIYAHLPNYRPRRVCVYQGQSIGHKAICVFPTIRTAKLVVEIEDHDGTYRLLDMKAFYAK